MREKNVLRTLLRLSPAIMILLIALAAVLAGVPAMLTWQTLGARQAELAAFVLAQPILAAAAYVGTYVAIIAASLPLAAVATVAGGLLFGPVVGPVLTVLGATAGASVAFFAMRGVFAALLARRAAGLVARLAPRLRQDGLSFVLAMRLLPVVPFWLVNLAAGASGMSWRPFALGTLVGVVPATIVYSGIGAGIGAVLAEGREPDLRVILSPPILLPLIGLAALALLPVAWRRWRGGRNDV